MSEPCERTAWLNKLEGFIPAWERRIRYWNDENDKISGEGMRAGFKHGDCIDVFCVTRKNEDIPGVRDGGGEGQRNMKIRASKSVHLSIYVYTFINKHEP